MAEGSVDDARRYPGGTTREEFTRALSDWGREITADDVPVDDRVCLFTLERDGHPVGDGVTWPDGTATVHAPGKTPVTTSYDDMGKVLAAFGEDGPDGRTRVVWSGDPGPSAGDAAAHPIAAAMMAETGKAAGDVPAADPEALTDDAVYWITVSVPARIGVDLLDGLFTAVADAVHEWEPDDRDGWDADVMGSVEGDVPPPPEAQPCRPVDLPDGTTVRVQGMLPGEPPAELTAALADVADTVRRNHAADPEAPRHFVRCERTDMHGPHPVALTCPGIHAADVERYANSKGSLTGSITTEDANVMPTPPGRLADEVREAIKATVSQLEMHAGQDEITAALMDCVVGPLIAERNEASGDLERALYRRDEAWRELRRVNAERDEQRQRAEALHEERKRAISALSTVGRHAVEDSGDLEDGINADTALAHAEAEAIRRDLNEQRERAERLVGQVEARQADLAERNATIAELRDKLRIADEHVERHLTAIAAIRRETEGYRARLAARITDVPGLPWPELFDLAEASREAVARVREARTRVADAGGIAMHLSELDAALDGTDGGETP